MSLSTLFIHKKIKPAGQVSRARISLFTDSKDGHLSSIETAAHFLPSSLRPCPKFSIFMENCSHFDWWNLKMSKTIAEIPNCGAPTGCFTPGIVALTLGGSFVRIHEKIAISV